MCGAVFIKINLFKFSLKDNNSISLESTLPGFLKGDPFHIKQQVWLRHNSVSPHFGRQEMKFCNWWIGQGSTEA
jgi:hypothetical protein